MSVGDLATIVLAVTSTALALAPPRPARSSPSNLTFWLGYLVNEVPALGVLWVVTATVPAAVRGDLVTPASWAGVGLGAATLVGLVVVARRGLTARPVLERALDEALGSPAPGDARVGPSRPRDLVRGLLAPVPVRPRDVVRVAGIPYGDAGRAQRLDVYHHRARSAGAPVLVHLHGGAFRHGGKSRESRHLLHRLAARGWVCVSANYRLVPATRYAGQLADVRRVLAWVRAHASAYGGDPSTLVVAGCSAGGHLAATAGLTDPDVAAVVALYPWAGQADADDPGSTPFAHLHPDAPPFLVVHGDQDTLVLVDDARAFVRALRRTSAAPVAYAELPGAQHTFDIAASPRCAAVADAVDAFAQRVTARRPEPRPDQDRDRAVVGRLAG